MRSLLALALCGASVGIAALGCGDGGAGRHDLSGVVTFRGQPVPGGEIMFTPDASQGNSGPGAVALIKHGRYETFADKGAVGGPHLVTVIGYQDIPGTVPESQLHELFPPTQLKLDLPTASGEFDIQVP